MYYFNKTIILWEMILNIGIEMAYSVGPDQTAPAEQSDLGLHCLSSLLHPNIYISYHIRKDSRIIELLN